MDFWKLLSLFFLSLVVLTESQLQGLKMQFKLSALNLSIRDMAGSDPYVKCFIKDNVNRAYQKFGETQILYKNLNPVWPEVFLFQYVNGTSQRLKFLVKDWEFGWIADRHLGRAEVNADDLVKEMMKNGLNGTLSDRPIQLFLTQPKGGILVYTPVLG